MSTKLRPFFNSEFLASGLSTEFYEFVTKLTQSKSKTEETSHVTEQLWLLSNKMGLPDISSTKMRDYLIRLMHCHMLGYTIDFSLIYCIMSCQSGESALDKRVAYLCCNLFMSDNELQIMLINTLQRDLRSSDESQMCAALNTIAYLDNKEMVDSVLDLVVQCMSTPKQMVRKKAVIALYFLYSKFHVEPVLDTLKQALEDKDYSVVFAALSVWKLIVGDHADEEVLQRIHAIHRQIMEKRIHKSFIYHGVLAPWAQLDCLAIYKMYHDLNIGSPKEYFTVVMECLQSMDNKVDAAFAIVLECIKLLADIDPILLSSFSQDENPFIDTVSSYLSANNHNLKYLGILAMTYIDHCFWSPDWLDGTLLGSTLSACPNDDTLITQVLENLDRVVSFDVLKNISENMIDALSKNSDNKPCNTTIGYWFINRLVETEERDDWFVETMVKALAETRRNLDDDYVETQCSLLKQELIAELNDTVLRSSSVRAVYHLLKKTNSDVFSPIFTQFAFWTLGENGYVCCDDMDTMQQLVKWLTIVSDDYLQTCGLQAMKRCILRSKKYLSCLESTLKEYKKSRVPEKQTIATEIYEIIQDVQFEKECYETDLTTSINKLSINPNRPKEKSKFKASESPVKLSSGLSSLYESSLTAKSSSSRRATIGTTTAATEITPDEFGQLWTTYQHSKKQRFDCSLTHIDRLSRKLSKKWHFEVIQIIGQEMIAIISPTLLLHIVVINKQFELTVKSETSGEITDFIDKIIT